MKWLLALLLLLPGLARAADIELKGNLTQGGMAIGHAAPGSKVSFEGGDMPVAADGTFVLGFTREAPRTATLIVTTPNGAQERRVLSISRRNFVVQRVDGLPEPTVNPPPAILARIKADIAKVVELRKSSINTTDFAQPWQWPAIGPITGVFGSQRILNGRPSTPHFGVDIGAPAGSAVSAPAGGVVILAEELYLTGNTVIVDHGLGVNSTYAHLSSMAVKVGDRIKQGQLLGKIGATGRATGPHLHWGLNVGQVRVDAALLVPLMPDNAPKAK
ncbi:MAG: M23 family metallopeptidase [Rhodospirillales bacterium]